MVAFVTPTKCFKCRKRRKLFAMHLPAEAPKKKGKVVEFTYTPMVWICDKCIDAMWEWLNEEKKKIKI